MHRITAPLAAVTACGLLLAGCSDDETPNAADGPVCGVVDRALVTGFTGSMELTEDGQLDPENPEEDEFGGQCEVYGSGGTLVLQASTEKLSTGDQERQHQELLNERKSTAGPCPDFQTVGDWANVCVDDTVRLTAVTDTLSIYVSIQSTVDEVTADQAVAIAENIDETVG